MKKINLADLPEDEIRSPTGKFHSFCRNITIALGGLRNTGTWGGGHPFDLQIRRIPPGAAVCPFHSHVSQWELFVIRSGAGFVRTTEGRTAVKPGDVFVHPPGVPHQLFAGADTELEVLIVTDNPPVDGCHYPDSNKWSMRPPAKLFRMTETDYFDGEDTPVPGVTPYQIAPPPAAAPVAPFARRQVNLDDLVWEPWESPKKKFRAASKELSMALGAKRNTPTSLGGHPFDLEFTKVAPGDSPCPFHSHAAQWELYFFLAGTATVRTAAGTTIVGAGDIVLHPPGEAHAFTNTGRDDVLCYLIADNPPVDYWHYPDSNKWGLRAPRKFFRLDEVDYYDGEE